MCVFGLVLFCSVAVNRYADNQSNRITEFTLCFNNTVFFLLLPLKIHKRIAKAIFLHKKIKVFIPFIAGR